MKQRLLLSCLAVLIVLEGTGAAATFRAGAAVSDVTPRKFPVIVNAMFEERSADKVADPLFAKALVLDDGTTRVAFCIVDSCMVPRELIDAAKEIAAQATGIPANHMLISATHTHSAPSAMGCLGSRADPEYAASLPPKIAEAITAAAGKLQPARVAWARADDWEHTFNRRWIRRPDRMLTDPFGQQNVRAHMHPGHQSADAIGPSGPVDPALTLLAIETLDHQPLALLANYSQHYYGSPLLSSDYFGRFAKHVAADLGVSSDAARPLVAMMSQGTSGDLMWMDYGAPRREIGYDAYAGEIAARVATLWRGLDWETQAPLRVAERSLELPFRVPDAARLEWARKKTAALGTRLPTSLPDIYAAEALHLHERQKTELKLQAIRVGDLGIAALPNEVFALTGLKLKARSPFATTMNIELANGAEGYIPPPEQHALGGYTTWPARTAGLEVQAEPRIVETLLSLLEEVAEKPLREPPVEHGPYARAVLAAKPLAYWRFDEMEGPAARDAAGGKHDAIFESGVALYLPGAGSGTGISPDAALKPSAFSGALINRAVHFAGGRARTSVALGERFSAELWLWNGLPHEARAVTGYVFSRGPDGDKAARGEHLGIGGTFRGDLTGKLMLFNGNERDQVLAGRTTLAQRAWHHVVLVRDGRKVRVHLDGRAEPEITADFEHTVPAGEQTIFFGGRNDGLFGLEGRLDEVALYERALTTEEIATHYQASALTPPAPPPAAAPAPVTAVESQPLSPLDSLKKIHVQNGYGVELVAPEPLTIDPVAIDWDAAGRLWVVEMADYPLGMDGKGKPGGRVRVLDDTDSDGRYDKSALFADGLSFPTGLLTWRDGVIVTAAPDILFLRDTDGDGKADTRDVLVSGLTTGNQQLRANGLRWGLDGWVYCAAGGHHGEYGVGTKLRTRAGEVVVGSRDFRFRPDTGELEPQSGPSQFGRNRDDWGHWFGTQNSRPLWHYVLADHYLRRNPHVAAPDPTRQVVVPLNPKVWPMSAPEKRFHSFNEGGHFTSACSGMIYRDELLFGRSGAGEMHAFTCEPFHNLVQHNVLADAGVSFTARRAAGEETSEFFASEDRWCRPVMTRTGPDGALWVVDMYRYMIEHPEWLPKEGKAELLPHYRLGEDRGRIYRVFLTGIAPRKIAPLDKLSTPELVAALESPNGWQRDKAHMLLVWRGDKAVRHPLEKMALENPNALSRVQALWALEGLGVLSTQTVAGALADRHAGVRENALRIAERHSTPETIAAAAKLVDDTDAKVRLQLAFTLGEWKDQVAGEALGRLAVANHAEPFITAAVMSSAVPHLHALADAATKAGGKALAALAPPLTKLAQALGDRDALATLGAPVGTGATVSSAPVKLPPTSISPPARRVKVVEQFQPALKLTGDSTRGRAVFTQLCVTCHKLGDAGQEIGPNLLSVAGHPPDKLLANILDPNADVQPGFFAHLCRLTDGTEIYGLIAAETANSITLKQLDGTTRAVLRNEIVSLESTGGSLMPVGLEAGITPQSLADVIAFLRAGDERADIKTGTADIRVGAAAEKLRADDSMPLAGYLEARFTKEQEGELRAVAVVIEQPGSAKVAIVACDVLWVTRAIVDPALAEIERTTGIPPSHVVVNATHTHHAPGTAPAHAFGWSPEFADEVRRGIVKSVQDANARLAEAAVHFALGEERTVGGNSRLLLGDSAISWLNPLGEAGARVEPTGPFDPQLPVLDFRGADGKSRALIFNHSTHTIGTRSGRDVRSPSFYGLAAQELEAELGGVVNFLEGASGSTHNIRGVSVPVAIARMKRAVLDARSQAAWQPIARIAAIKRPFTFRVRQFDEAAEHAKVARYTAAHAAGNAARIREIFAEQRRQLASKQGEERTTFVQAIVIGEVAIVGVPAEYFTGLGLEIKRRSPFKHTIIAELANDWIGYLPDREGHRLGGYQTWTGLHSYAEPGTGERIAEEALRLLDELTPRPR